MKLHFGNCFLREAGDLGQTVLGTVQSISRQLTDTEVEHLASLQPQDAQEWLMKKGLTPFAQREGNIKVIQALEAKKRTVLWISIIITFALIVGCLVFFWTDPAQIQTKQKVTMVLLALFDLGIWTVNNIYSERVEEKIRRLNEYVSGANTTSL